MTSQHWPAAEGKFGDGPMSYPSTSRSAKSLALSTTRLATLSTFWSGDCAVCDAFSQYHYRSCCDCRSCRRYTGRHGHCRLCALNPTPRP